ncbi:hypothetical protein KBK19_03170 [Microvirga sp. STR05]|uniref:DUF2314 domain-containing protein n=1 Tax=Hymenobacter duratus TaxID=2771356 RepID=A0ABR8JBF7_9BACT|nr:hypothetical protein [Hymenobacter duratus]MBD2714030.1 hypothetical protein [Hymenobacter duratus]MBR7948932.1 hypothetical protein [Microvirga sp. STR05]
MRYWMLTLIMLGNWAIWMPAVQAQQPEIAVPAVRLALQLTTLEILPPAPLKEARRTLAQARQRFTRGLNPGETLYVTATLLNDAANRVPQLVHVQTWQDGRVMGRLVGSNLPDGNNKEEFDESEIVDWMILHQDGAEEGNYVGKFLDLEERLGSLTGPR